MKTLELSPKLDLAVREAISLTETGILPPQIIQVLDKEKVLTGLSTQPTQNERPVDSIVPKDLILFLSQELGLPKLLQIFLNEHDDKRTGSSQDVFYRTYGNPNMTTDRMHMQTKKQRIDQ